MKRIATVCAAALPAFAAWAVPAPPPAPAMSEWAFVEELKLPESDPAPPAGSRPGDLKSPWLTNRISRCYFSPIKRKPYFRDELTDDIDYYPDAYLERLRNEGVNGLWISAEFRELAETSFNRRDPKGLQRLAKLAKTVAKCRAHGIKVWLFGIEPRCFKPGDPLLKEHPEFGGSKAGWIDWTMMCPSEPNVLKFLEEQTRDIFSHVPGLAGLLLITNGEGMMTCLSCRHVTGEEPYPEHFTCERCRNRPNWQLHSAVVGAMVRGMRSVDPKAELLSWFYQPASTPNRLEWVADAARHLPEGVSIVYNFESGGLKKQAGRWRCGGDYWLSYPGPAMPFRNVAAAAREAGTRIGAKIQTANSHECATVPYIPAPGLIYRKMKAMREAGVSDVMMCWFFGNYPGIMNRAVGELAYSDFKETEGEYLAHLAGQAWGGDAPVVARLWQDFTDGYSEYPFSNAIQYYGPFHDGVAWPLLARVECDRLAHTWVPDEPPSGDMVCECLRDFTIDEAALLAKTMADRCSGRGVDGEDAIESLAKRHVGDRERLRDLGVMKTLRALFRSGAEIFRFYRLRSEAIYRSRICGDAASARAALREMREIVLRERDNTRTAIPLAKADSRIGFHSEAQSYKFWPGLLEWRLDRLGETVADIDAIDTALARGEPYPESDFERNAPCVAVGDGEIATTNVAFRLRRRENGDLAVVGRARAHVRNLVFGAFDAACVKYPTHAYLPRPGSGENTVYLPGATDEMSASAAPAENGEWTFEVVFRAAAWSGDDRLRPGWFAIMTDAFPQTWNGRWIWPESGEQVRSRLCLPWLWGKCFGRIDWQGRQPASDTDRCTFDLKAISERLYGGGGGDNLAEPSGWHRLSTSFLTKNRTKEEVSALKRKIESLVDISFEGGMAAIRVPCEAVDIQGDRKQAAHLQAYIGKRVMLENATGGVRRVSLQYRSNHELGTQRYCAYVFAQPVVVKEVSDSRPKNVGKWQCRDFRDTGEDSDYVIPWSMDVDVPEGANAIDFKVRFMGAGYLKFTGFTVTTRKPDPPRPDIRFQLVNPYHFADGRFEIESGKVGAVTVGWNCSKTAAIDWSKCWLEVDVPAGFEFIGSNLKEDPERDRAMARRRLEDGFERIRLPMCGEIRPHAEERFHVHNAPALLVRALKPAGFEATLKLRALGPDGKAFDRAGSCILAASEPFAAIQPKHYRAGAMLTYTMQHFRTGEGANEAYADYIREKGITWLIPNAAWMVENPRLLPMWRRKGFDVVTPFDHDYLMNAYNIHGTCPRPPDDGFVPRPGLPDLLRKAACPASIYEERPFFVTNIVPNLAARSAGTDGQWVNWEPFFFKGCQCDYCKRRGAEWQRRTGDDSIEHFYSWQHGELVKTVNRWMKKTFRPGTVGLMPAICWAEMCGQSRRNGYPKDKLSKDFAGDVDWIPAWGPYVGWSPWGNGSYGGPYAIPKGSCVQCFIAAKDVREENDRAYPAGRRPKLMGQPAGANWLIQPEWLEISCDSFFFNRWEAIAPWVFPEGADARHWRAYARSITRAAKFERAVWDGKRADEATDIVAKPGFEEYYTSLDKAYFAAYPKVSLLQQTTYDHGGSRHVACFNFNDERHAEFMVKTRGLPSGEYMVVDEDGKSIFGGRTFSADALASDGVALTLPASRCRVFSFVNKTEVK